jgi:hypothetical protein
LVNCDRRWLSDLVLRHKINTDRHLLILLLLLLLQGYRPLACFRPQDNTSSHLARYFGVLWVYNLAISLGVCLL